MSHSAESLGDRCSCDFCRNVAGAVMSSTDGAEVHIHPTLFWDDQLGPLHIGVFGALALHNQHNGHRGTRMDDIVASWADNEHVTAGDITQAVHELAERGYLVARAWIPGSHEVRWFIGGGLTVPHIAGQPCDICPTFQDNDR